MEDPEFAALRAHMLEEIAGHARAAGPQTGKQTIDAAVMAALGRVPRHDFIPAELHQFAYADTPLPIGCGKTISQPFIVALMTDLLEVAADDRVLEIGTGLGYQAAVLAELAAEIRTVEIVEELGRKARASLKRLGYGKVALKLGDGYYGWPEHAPYDKVIVTAAPELVPPPLIDQLKPGGRMVIPAGIADAQQLMLVVKDASGRVSIREVLPVRFSRFEAGERDE